LFWGRDDLPSGQRLEEEAQLSGAVELRAACGTEETVVTDFRGAFGQNVLKKPVNEFGSGKLDVADLLSLVVTVAEADNAVVERFQTAVGNGDAEDVAGKIVEDFLATAGVLGMNNPANLPDEGWNESKKACIFQSGTELGAKDDRQSGVGNEPSRMFGINPGLAIGRESSGSNQHVNVRMEEHGAGPGVEDGQSTDTGSQITGIGRKFLKGIGGGLHQ
jgi:hypothetical protein